MSVHAVGFGDSAPEAALNAMAFEAGKHEPNNYKFAGVGSLGEAFKEIADQIGVISEMPR